MRQRDGHYVDDDERDKILEAIEQQARSISQARGTSEGQRLSDWLSAAEDVMPEVKKPAVKPMSLSKPSSTESGRGMSASALMGVVAAGTVVVGMAVGGTLAYLQVMEKMGDLEDTSQYLADRLASFESVIKEVQQSSGEKMMGISDEGDVQAVSAPNHAVSAEFIDARLQAQTSLIAKEMEDRFQTLMDRLDHKLASIRAEQMEKLKEIGSANTAVSAPIPVVTLAHPPVVEASLAMTAPVSSAVTPAPIAPIAAPSAPTVPEPSVKTPENAEASGDQAVDPNAWLMGLNSEIFVLQLGSSPKMEGLNPTIKKMHDPDAARLLSVKANGTQRYILVTGPFETREEAKKAADQARIELGITAWMRKVSDVRALIERQ